MLDRSISLIDPMERVALEPFATAFVQIIVPDAIRGDWFESRQEPPHEDLAAISRRVNSFLQQRIGHGIHPAIYIHALLVCSSFFSTAPGEDTDPTEQERQDASLDAAFSLLQHLMLHHGLYDLYVRLC